MRDVSTEAVARLAELEDLDLGGEIDAVADRLNQLLAFAKELDGLAPDATDVDAAFDPRWADAR